jgi:hypothetical protein
MSGIGLLWIAASAPSYGRFRHALRHPRRIQERLLRGYLTKNASTAFGRAHGFGEIRSTLEYQERVPLRRYRDYEGFIKRIQSGEQSVLTRESVGVLQSTGGTTSRKRIPYSQGLQRELRNAVGPWILDLWRRHPAVARGRSYWSISPVDSSMEPESSIASSFEDDAEYLGRFSKRIIRSTFAVPSMVRHISDVEAFRYVTCLHLLRAADLALISVWHPTFLTLLMKTLAADWERLVTDIEHGRVSPAGKIPSSLHAALLPSLRPNPRRATEIRRLGPEPSFRSAIWPQLQVVSCWGDGHAALHLDEVRREFPGVTVQPKGLLATEGCVTIPFEGQTPLAIRSHFFEFLESDGTSRLAHDVQPGGTYSVVLTTGGGLYRYRLEDRVRCTGFLERTPTLQFLGKEAHLSDLVGEKLSEEFVVGVLRHLFAQFAITPAFALLAPDGIVNGTAGYTLYLESARSVPRMLARALDDALCGHGDYAYARRLEQLRPARLFRIERDGAVCALGRACADGQRLGDIKPLALSTANDWSSRFEGTYANEAEGSTESRMFAANVPDRGAVVNEV